MASDQHIKNRMQVFKNKGKDQDVSTLFNDVNNQLGIKEV